MIDGDDLSEIVKRDGKLAVDRTLRIVEEVAEALRAALAYGVIHRDIKPANIMLTRAGQVKVSDLGLAKVLADETELTMSGVGLGSPHFIAPEQGDDAKRVDHRADIYSLGITTLFLLTGKRPSRRYPDYDALLADLRLVKENPEVELAIAPAPAADSENRRGGAKVNARGARSRPAPRPDCRLRPGWPRQSRCRSLSRWPACRSLLRLLFRAAKGSQRETKLLKPPFRRRRRIPQSLRSPPVDRLIAEVLSTRIPVPPGGRDGGRGGPPGKGRDGGKGGPRGQGPPREGEFGDGPPRRDGPPGGQEEGGQRGDRPPSPPDEREPKP